MIDLKHHIYSLVGIFIALATGILIGIGLAGGPATQNKAIEHQSDRIQSLQREFKTFSAQLAGKDGKISDLSAHLKEVDGLVESQFAALVQGGLTGRGVAIIHVGASSDVEPIRLALKASGAVVHSETTLLPDLLALTPELMAKGALALPMAYQQAGKDPLPLIFSYLSMTLAQGLQGDPFAGLKQAGLVDVEGDYAVANRFVLIVVPSEDDAKMIEAIVGPLAAQIKANGLKVAIAAMPSGEPSKDQAALRDVWKDVDAAVVKHSDMAMGRVCLVDALLRGEGRYGLGRNERILPDKITFGKTGQ